MGKKCLVYTCSSDENTKNITLYRLGSVRYKSWLTAIGRNYENLSPYSVICSKHFQESDFVVTKKRRNLKKGAIPRLLLPRNVEWFKRARKQELSSPSFRCFVHGCLNSEGNVTDATFHKFPKELQEEWLLAIGKNKDTPITDELICSQHFQSTDFENDDFIILKQNAIPHLNVFEESENYLEVKENLDLDFTSNSSNKSRHDEYDDDGDNVDVDAPSCRTCLGDLGPKGGYVLSGVHNGNRTLKEMIAYCIPQMASTVLNTDHVCEKCLESIKYCMSFIESCLKVEAQLLESQEDIFGTPYDNLEDSMDDYSPQELSYMSITSNHDDISDEKSEVASEDTLEYNTVNDLTKHECNECNQTFRTKNYLLSHIRKMHSEDKDTLQKRKISTYDCKSCTKSFLTKLGYDLHVRLSHHEQIEKKKESGWYTCKVCGNKFTSFRCLTQHKTEAHGFSCVVCSQVFPSKSELRTHSEQHPQKYLCDVCGKRFITKIKLKAHMITHNDPNTNLCHVCGQGFKSQTALTQHFKQHDPEKKFHCDQCPAAFWKKQRLEEHQKVKHLGLLEYKCTMCDKKFCYKYNLQSHYRLKHSEEKPYQCEHCGVGFARSDYLKRHTVCGGKKRRNDYKVARKRRYRYKKDDSVPIKCKLCNKVFKDIQMLILHAKTHTKFRRFKCRKCSLTFTTSGNRFRHEKVHEDSLFRCEVCFKKLETQEALDEHCASTHENTKKYKCHVCDELFGRKYLLHSHVADVHGTDEDFQKEKEVVLKVVMQDYLIDN